MTSAQSRAMAVLIVAYRSPDMLETCIRSVQEHLDGLEVHVWDNSGPNYSGVRNLADRMEYVHWYLNSENIGFAAAVNRLAEMVPGRDLLLLNPDAEVVGPMSLLRAAIRVPGTAAAAPLIREPDVADGPSLLSGKRLLWDVAHRQRTLVNTLGGLLVRNERLRGTCLSDLYRSQPGTIDGYLTGACLAISRDAWDSLGSFDEEFFLYGEEADWQKRAIDAGWQVRLADEVGARHSPLGTVTGDPAASTRSWDLYRANVALQLEYRYGVFAAEIYLVAATLAESLKRIVRRQHKQHTPHSDVLVTVDGSHAASEGVDLALALARDGCAVTVASLQRLGNLPRELPPSIRLVRSPFWWPSTSPGGTPTVLVVGTTNREQTFAGLFRLRRNRRCIAPSVAISNLVGAESAGERTVTNDMERT